MVGKVLAVQMWEPEVGSTAPIQEAVCGNRVFVKETRTGGFLVLAVQIAWPN